MPPEFAVFTGVDMHESEVDIVDRRQSAEDAWLESERQLHRRKLAALIQEGLRGFDPASLRPEHEVRQCGTSDWRRLPEEYDTRQGEEFMHAAQVLAAFKVAQAVEHDEFPTAA